MIHKMTEEDFDLMEHWLHKRGREIPDRSLLPDIGYMAHVEGKPVICAFLSLNNSKLATIGNIASDPENKNRRDAIEPLIEFLGQEAQKLGYRYVALSTNLIKFKKRLINMGFDKIDEDLEIFGRGLKCQ